MYNYLKSAITPVRSKALHKTNAGEIMALRVVDRLATGTRKCLKKFGPIRSFYTVLFNEEIIVDLCKNANKLSLVNHITVNLQLILNFFPKF